MAAATLEQLQAHAALTQRRYATVPGLDDYGIELRVRSLSEGERARLVEDWPGDASLTRARLIQVCLVNDEGHPLFMDDRGRFDDDVEAIADWDNGLTSIVGDFLFDFLRRPATEGN